MLCCGYHLAMFAYMGKPVLYYQFDREEFFTRQYQKSSFDVEKDGFGPVCETGQEMIGELRNYVLEGFQMRKQYNERMREFYPLYDTNNSERVYEEIQRKPLIHLQKQRITKIKRYPCVDIEFRK